MTILVDPPDIRPDRNPEYVWILEKISETNSDQVPEMVCPDLDPT